MEKEEIFWADTIAKEIIKRKKFHYIDKLILKLKEFTVKTSASLSGVLHIGRLSDTIRGESVFQALQDAGVKAKFIWVAENMDPLRKIPKNIPKKYERYLGMAVTDIPDPDGCHKSYADHFMQKYFEVIDEFVFTKMKKFSMREEYKKGHFKLYIKKILEHIDEVKEIQNKHRTSPLPEHWLPWTPICESCGKILTPQVIDVQDGKVLYECKDYKFEKTTAKGRGHKGENDPLKGEGKLMWKSEWAAQWAKWKVVAEGAGKEYQVPNSAWWINGEIVEKVFDFPMPQPIFYEHIMINNQKMSASLGNVVYPRDWLEVAPPELLRLFYNKRLMKTRSFSWRDLPKLYDEDDYLGEIYTGKAKYKNKRKQKSLQRLYEISHGKQKPKKVTLSFSHAVIIAQAFPNEKDAIKSLEKTGHYEKKYHNAIFERLEKAKKWLELYAPEEGKFSLQEEVPKGLSLTNNEKFVLHKIAELLKEKDWDEKSLFEEFYEVSKANNLEPKQFFKVAYRVLINKEQGPKLAPFILAIGKEKAIKLFEKV